MAWQANLLIGQSVPLSHRLPVCCSPVVAWQQRIQWFSKFEETKQETSLTPEAKAPQVFLASCGTRTGWPSDRRNHRSF